MPFFPSEASIIYRPIFSYNNSCTSTYLIYPSEIPTPVHHCKYAKVYFQALDMQEAQLG